MHSRIISLILAIVVQTALQAQEPDDQGWAAVSAGRPGILPGTVPLRPASAPPAKKRGRNSIRKRGTTRVLPALLPDLRKEAIGRAPVAQSAPAAPAPVLRPGWTHPMAITGGLMPIVVGAVLAGVRFLRFRKARRRYAGAAVPPVTGPLPSRRMPLIGPVAAEIAQMDDGVTGAARRHGTGQGEIRLARLLERGPKGNLKRMTEQLAPAGAAVDDTGLARSLRVGKGEIHLAMRLKGLLPAGSPEGGAQ